MADVDEREYREALTAFRKRRGLLSRAYRAYRRDARHASRRSGARGDLLLKAADLVGKGQAEGINVGGIQRHDQIQDMVHARLRQTMANTEALERALTRPQESTLAPVPTAQPQVAPLSAREDDEAPIDWANYNPSYLNNRALFSY